MNIHEIKKQNEKYEQDVTSGRCGISSYTQFHETELGRITLIDTHCENGSVRVDVLGADGFHHLIDGAAYQWLGSYGSYDIPTYLPPQLAAVIKSHCDTKLNIEYP